MHAQLVAAVLAFLLAAPAAGQWLLTPAVGGRVTAVAVTGFTASRCARFDGSGNLAAATADCTAGDTTGAPVVCFTTADQTSIVTTFAAVSWTCTAGSTLTAGAKYVFKCSLFMSDSVAADGAKIDFNGGTATETDFRAQVTAFDSALNISTHIANITDAASATTFTGSGNFEVHGSFEPLAGGTLVPRFAQNAHTTGTLTLFRGSHCVVWTGP